MTDMPFGSYVCVQAGLLMSAHVQLTVKTTMRFESMGSWFAQKHVSSVDSPSRSVVVQALLHMRLQVFSYQLTK